MKRERLIYLDVIRIVACCMIILMHSPHPDAGSIGYIVAPLSFITESGIGLFFMVSGSLLLFNQDTPIPFIKKRLSKVVFPTLFWSFFYLCVRLIQGNLPIKDILGSVLAIPFSAQGNGVLWFMYTLICLYLLTPILSVFLRQATRKEVELYLIIWTIMLFFPFIKNCLTINETTTGVLYYFSGFIGYYVLGYYLRAYQPKISIILSILLICVPIIAWGGYVYLGFESWLTTGRFGYLSVFVVAMCIGWYALLKHLSDYVINRWRLDYNRLAEISNCCFGVYLMHIFIMRSCIWKSSFIVYSFGGIGQIVLTWLLTILFSFLLTYWLAYIPYSEYIIGYNRKHFSKFIN